MRGAPAVRSAGVAVLLVVLATACLRQPAIDAGLGFGYAVDPGRLAAGDLYRAYVEHDATVITPENHMKWSLIHPAREAYDFAAADQIVAFAEDQGMQVRGHTLVWHNQLPDWLTSATWTRTELIDVLRDHIHTVVGHFRDEYPGVVTQWDVVNEAFRADGSRRPTIWQQVIGDDYIELAFRFAREADPDAELFYSDYYDHAFMAADSIVNGQPSGQGANAAVASCSAVPKCVSVRDHVAELLDGGVPVDGIGFQAHIFGTQPTDYAAFGSWVEPLGLQWAITELDVALGGGDGDDTARLEDQGRAFAKVLDACLGSPACDTVVLWGVSDADSWLPGVSGGFLDHGLLYDHGYAPKPALVYVLATLNNAAA